MSDRPTDVRDPGHGSHPKLQQIKEFADFVKLAGGLQRHTGMSVVRTMSLIVGAALVALGGSALALFL